MFSIMGNCISWMRERRKPHRKVTIAIFGLDNAGKTVTTKGLQGDSLDTVAPTIGFSRVEFCFQRTDITLYDIGGGKRIRDIWRNYFSEIYGLIFVVDSTDVDRMDECKQILTSILEDPLISGKPILLLANKQDCPGAMDELDVCQHLNLEEVVNMNKCPCRVETCSAIQRRGKKIDKSITDGLKWLMLAIQLNWEKLTVRIMKDITDQKEREKIEKKRREEIVRKKREERDRKEREERQLRGEPESEDEEDDEPPEFTNGNPFKRVDVEELTRKQQKLKAEKLLQKQRKLKQSTVSESEDSDEKPAPKSSKSHSRSRSSDRQGILDSSSDELASPQASHPRLSNARLHGNEVEMGLAAKSPWLKERSPRPADSGNLSSRSSKHLSDKEQSDVPLRGRVLMPIHRLEPLETVGGRRRRKKKKMRRNQVSAIRDDDAKSDTSVASNDQIPQHSPNRGQLGGGDTPPSQRSQAQHEDMPPGQRSQSKASRSPHLTAPRVQREPESQSFSQRWGFAEDLPDLPDTSSLRRTRPNMDSGEDIIT